MKVKLWIMKVKTLLKQNFEVYMTTKRGKMTVMALRLKYSGLQRIPKKQTSNYYEAS